MMTDRLNDNVKYLTKYVPYKISQIQWNVSSLQTFEAPTTFASGSWDETENYVEIWSIFSSKSGDEEEEDEANLLCSFKQNGDVSRLQFINDNKILASSTTGDLNLLKFDLHQKKIGLVHQWKGLQKNNFNEAPCTSFATFPQKGQGQLGSLIIATVGEDGSVNIVTDILEKGGDRIEKNVIDSTTTMDILFLNEYNICSVNSIGQMKIFDRRCQFKSPTQLINITADHAELYCLDVHPTRIHTIACGGYDGNLYIVDTRMPAKPASIHAEHSFDLMQIKFHEYFPNNIFTCSGDGSILHWRSDDMNVPALVSTQNNSSQIEADLSTRNEVGESKFECENLLIGNSAPVNCFDIHSSSMIGGTDNNQLTLINGLFIH